MVIAQVMAGAPTGGAELFYERLCAALHDAGETVVPIIRTDPARAGRLRAAGLAPHDLRFGGWLDVTTRTRLKRLLRTAAPAIVIAWMGRAAAATPSGDWTLIGRLGGYYDLRRFAHCRHLIANTADIAAWIIRQGWAPARVHHLPNFVPDLAGSPPINRTTLGVPDDATLLLALGRLHPAKGFDTLIRALPDLPGRHAVIAGVGPKRAALQHLAAAQGVADRVHLIGWQSDTAGLLAACDVFICPSRHEPLGNVVLEAWSATRPVIATAAQGPGALIRDGQDGMLVPIDDPAALRAAIERLVQNPAHAADLAAAGRARYEAAYTPTRVVAQWRGCLASVAA